MTKNFKAPNVPIPKNSGVKLKIPNAKLANAKKVPRAGDAPLFFGIWRFSA
jgi:hypothetical protein